MKVVIVGGSGNTEEYMNEICEMAKKDHRAIITGFLQGEELQEICSNAYLYVLPSDVEGMSVSLLETMSYGNCCLISDIQENTEVVGNMAVLFKKSSISGLKEQIVYLLEHPDVVQNYRDAAANYICEKYSWDKMVEQTKILYRK